MKIRKRIIVSVIITVLVVILLNKCWLVFEPIEVNFDLWAKGDYNIGVLLNKKDNNDFIKIKKKHQKIQLNGKKNLDFAISRSKHPKRIKITFFKQNSPYDKPIKITNIQFGKGKLKLDDLNAFQAKGADLTIKDSTLILTPQEQGFELTYNKTLNIHAAIKFELEILIIIIILTFLLCYKLTNYLADFNTIKQKPKTEIIFLAVFFTLLFIPLLHIEQGDGILKDENRVLSKWYPLIKEDGSINYNFGRNFENWFNDRFFTRELCVSVKPVIFADKETSMIAIGKDEWLFYKFDNSINNFQNLDLFTQEELEKAAEYLVSIDNYCKKHNKNFYFIITPDKNKIYGEYFPERYKKARPDNESRAFQLVHYLEKHTDVKVIYLYDTLMQNKDKGLLYFKHDTHWNTYGAYLGYKEIIRHMVKDNIDVEPRNYDDIITKKRYFKTYYDMYYTLPKMLRPHYDESEYLVVEPEQKYTKVSLPSSNKSNKFHETIITTRDIKAPAICVYRDSFFTNLIPEFSNTFKKVKYIWTYKVDKEEADNADIVILEIVERYIPFLLKQNFEEDN